MPNIHIKCVNYCCNVTWHIQYLICDQNPRWLSLHSVMVDKCHSIMNKGNNDWGHWWCVWDKFFDKKNNVSGSFVFSCLVWDLLCYFRWHEYCLTEQSGRNMTTWQGGWEMLLSGEIMKQQTFSLSCGSMIPALGQKWQNRYFSNLVSNFVHINHTMLKMRSNLLSCQPYCL